MENRNRLTIILDHISVPQAIAFKKFFEFMQTTGQVGSSRWAAYFADGDGDFKPKIVAFYHDKTLAESEKKMQIIEHIKDEEVIGIDYDSIAWELREKENKTKEEWKKMMSQSSVANGEKQK